MKKELENHDRQIHQGEHVLAIVDPLLGQVIQQLALSYMRVQYEFIAILKIQRHLS